MGTEAIKMTESELNELNEIDSEFADRMLIFDDLETNETEDVEDVPY